MVSHLFTEQFEPNCSKSENGRLNCMQDLILMARRGGDPELESVFAAIQRAQDDATDAAKSSAEVGKSAAQALHEIALHQVECRGAYAALNTKIDSAHTHVINELWWLRAIIVGLLAVEILGLRSAVSMAMKWVGVS